MLRELRGERTVRELAKLANVPHSLIVSLENGKRSAGPKTSSKLADSLKLTGKQREAFLAAAQSTTQRNRVGPTATRKANVERVVFDLVLALTKLKKLAIKEAIFGKEKEYDILITKTDGGIIGIEIKANRIYLAEAPTVESLPNPRRISLTVAQPLKGVHVREISIS